VVLILSLVGCWPVGIVFVWMNKGFDRRTKIILTVLVLAIGIYVTLFGIATDESQPGFGV
jgi:hypothetical protein